MGNELAVDHLLAPKVYRDPVHGFISYERDGDLGRLLVTLIDTPAFQRLRFIRQVGLASLVFHGAEHTRFAHSMGVAHLAKRMFDRIHPHRPVDDAERIATIVAALLHDIGHGPFSHAMERVFDFRHEDYTHAMIRDPESSVCQVLQAYDPSLPDRVAAYIDGSTQSHTRDIVSSQLDADRLDYLLRDSLMTGVEVGRYDLERILLMLEHDEAGIVVNTRAFESIEGYLIARYHMYRLVYFHKNVRGAEAMLRMTFERARDLLAAGVEVVSPESVLGALMGGRTVACREFASLSEIEAWAYIRQWSRSTDPTLAELASSLIERRLFRSLEQRVESPTDRIQIEKAEAELISELTESERYLFVVDVAEDVPYKPYLPAQAQSGGPIRIRDNSGRLFSIEDQSRLVGTLAQASYQLRRWCYHRTLEDRVQRIADRLESTRSSER